MSEAGTRVPAPWAATRAEFLAAGVIFVLVALVFSWPLPARPGTTMTAHPFGDPLLNAWILAWGADRLLHGLSGFWTGLFFYPYPDTVAWSEHLLGITVFTAPIQWITGNPILAFNAALIGSTALAGFGAYLLARELTRRQDLALVAGIAFACSPYRVPQLYHLQVMMSGWMPIALWALHRHLATGSRRALAGFVAAFLLQALSNGYFLYFLALPVAIVSIHALWRGRERWWSNAAPLAGAAVAIGLGVAPFAAAYLRVKRELGLSRTLGDIIQFSADLASYAHVSDRLWLWGGVLPTGTYERELFPGALVVALSMVALWWAARNDAAQHPAVSHVRLYATIAVCALLLSLGPSPFLLGWRVPFEGPYSWLLAAVPGLGGLRVPARLAVIVYLALAVLAAFGLGRLTGSLAPGMRRAVLVAAALAIMAEGYRGPLAVERFPPPGMAADRAGYEWLAGEADGPMLALPVGGTETQVRHLYRTLTHGNRIVNGYSGYGSALQDLAAGPPFAEIERIDDGLAMARALGVRWVAVHPPLYEEAGFGDALMAAIAASETHVRRIQHFAGVSFAELRPLVPTRQALDASWRELPPQALGLAASHGQDRVQLMTDRDRTTRWATGTRQSGGEWIEVRLPSAGDVARVRLELDRRSLYDYPRGLVVETSLDGDAWTPQFEGGVLAPLAQSLVTDPRDPGIDLVLRPNHSARLRLRTIGETRSVYWSVHELRVWLRR